MLIELPDNTSVSKVIEFAKSLGLELRHRKNGFLMQEQTNRKSSVRFLRCENTNTQWPRPSGEGPEAA